MNLKEQYENFPYPPRKPEEITKTTLGNWKQGRCLDAGCGTGDVALHLARLGNEVTAIDISNPSLNVARARAKTQGLMIDFINISIFDLPKLDLGKFDYIVCSGVLHHINHVKGLETLVDALKPDGTIGIMVYAKYARIPIIMVQDALKQANITTIPEAKELIGKLPPNHPIHQVSYQKEASTDEGFYDLFLHSFNTTFSLTEVNNWLTRCGLKMTKLHNERVYSPRFYGLDSDDLQLGEMIGCNIYNHVFWAKRLP